ncbi:MAG: orotidine 5'-phosphate decarboxylase [Nitrososphaerota archaeon]|nr:orotidine 5'-phosphate decarboxylase [Nitrososphaerota archaeon]
MTGFRDRMLRSSSSRGSRVILNLDLWDPVESRLSRAEHILRATKEGIAGVKLNHHLLLPYGLRGLEGILELCHEEALPLVADLKVNDIESTNLNIVDSLFEFGFDALIVNPIVGRQEGLGGVLERAHSEDNGVIFLVYMSHKGASEGYELRLEGGKPLYRVFAERARDWGADGVIVSAKSTERMRETRGIVGRDCLIFSPGVGAQGGDARAGLAAGADFVLVGRAITEAPDPSKALSELLKP